MDSMNQSCVKVNDILNWTPFLFININALVRLIQGIYLVI